MGRSQPRGCEWPAGTTSIVGAVGTTASLDVGVSDDTCVDYLAVRFDQAVPTAARTWGSVKVWYR